MRWTFCEGFEKSLSYTYLRRMLQLLMQMRRQEDLGRYLELMHRAMWEQGRNLGDAAVLAATLVEGGFDADGISPDSNTARLTTR